MKTKNLFALRCLTSCNLPFKATPTNLLDFLSLPENKDAHMVMPLTWCPHLENFDAQLEVEKFDDKRPCLQCGHVGENWSVRLNQMLAQR